MLYKYQTQLSHYKENIAYKSKRRKLDFSKKTSQGRVENQQTQVKYDNDSGNVFRGQWWYASVSPLPQPCSGEPPSCERLKLKSLYPGPKELSWPDDFTHQWQPSWQWGGSPNNLLWTFLLTLCNSTTNGQFFSAKHNSSFKSTCTSLVLKTSEASLFQKWKQHTWLDILYSLW